MHNQRSVVLLWGLPDIVRIQFKKRVHWPKRMCSMKPAHYDSTVEELLKIAGAADNFGSKVFAVAAHAAAGLDGHWDSWLSIALILEEEAGANDALALFYRGVYLRELLKAAESKDIVAMRRLAGIYEFGQIGVEPIHERTIELLIEAAGLGDAGSMFELFEKYLYGLCSIKADKEAAFKWLKMAADHGHAEAKEWIVRFQEWDRIGFVYPRPRKND
ncbi:MAG: sel1 repeat family protein [Lysobacteraceae bacterium]|nr:MAG: sel1 repeat family protein [Xanthomonadaceae bacterium]